MAPGASEFERMTMLPAGAKASTAIADRRHAAAATATVRIFSWLQNAQDKKCQLWQSVRA